MTLINIKKIASTAAARGFKVNIYNGGAYAEIFAPDHEGAQAIIHNGSTYTSADFVLSDSRTGYGYNIAFYGPFHAGFCRSDDHGAARLLAHPLMSGE